MIYRLVEEIQRRQQNPILSVERGGPRRASTRHSTEQLLERYWKVATYDAMVKTGSIECCKRAIETPERWYKEAVQANDPSYEVLCWEST